MADQGYNTFDNGAEKPARFPANDDSACQDGGWVVAFVVHLLGVVGVIGWRVASDFGRLSNPEKEMETELTTGHIPGALVAVAFGIVAAVVWTVCVRCCAYGMLMMAIILDGLLLAAAAGLCAVYKNFIGAGVLGFCLAMYLLWLWCIWDRIPFTAQLISTATDIMTQAPGTLCYTFISLIVSFLFTCITLVGLVCLKFETEHHKKLPPGAVYGLLVLLVFSSYWCSAVISNVLHMTICGVVGRWYFKAADWASASSAALGRALGKSFGSICFGSFIIAVIRTIRFIISSAREAAEEQPALLVLLAVLDCLVSCLEEWAQFFNTYAFVYCSIYGMKFTEAGKRTWNLFMETGLDMILAYDLSGTLTFLGGLLGGLFSALLTFAAIHFTGDQFEMQGKGWLKPKDGELTPAYVFFGFLSGFIFVLIASTPIESGVTALLVCYAEEPDVLGENYPELSKRLADLNGELKEQKAQKEQEQAAAAQQP